MIFIVYSSDLDSHKKHVTTVPQLLDHQLYVKGKSEFYADTVPFLGFIAASEKVQSLKA